MLGHTGSVRSVVFSPIGNQILSGSEDGSIRVWDGKTGSELNINFKGHKGKVCCIALSGDGKKLASGSSDNTVRLWDAETGKELVEPLIHIESIETVSFSIDGKKIASGSSD